MAHGDDISAVLCVTIAIAVKASIDVAVITIIADLHAASAAAAGQALGCSRSLAQTIHFDSMSVNFHSSLPLSFFGARCYNNLAAG